MDRRQFLATSSLGTVAALEVMKSETRAQNPVTEARPLHLRYAINIGTHFTTKTIPERIKSVADADSPPSRITAFRVFSGSLKVPSRITTRSAFMVRC